MATEETTVRDLAFPEMANDEMETPFHLDPTVNMVYRSLKQARDKILEQRKEFEIADRFYANDQWTSEDLARFQREDRVGMVFNRSKRFIDITCGTEIQSRQKVKCIPRRPEGENQSAYADLATDAIRWALECCDGDDERSLAFFDTVKRGMGFTEKRLDFSVDLDGKLISERVDGNEMWWDTAAKKMNIEDRRWIARRRPVLRKEILERWPGSKEELEALSMNVSLDIDEPKVVEDVEPIGYTGTQIVSGAPLQKDDWRWLYVTQFQWWEMEPIYRVLDPASGEVKTFDKEQYEKLKNRMGRMSRNLRAVQQTRRKYWQAFVAGSVLLEKEPLPIQDDFTLQAMTGFRDEVNGIWFGMMRVLLDPQRAANKWLSQAIHILNTNAKNGYFAEQGAFLNPRKAEQDIAKPGSIVFTTPGALQNGKITPKQAAAFDTGYTQMVQYAVGSMHEVTGVTEPFTGDESSAEASGVAERQRMKQVMTALAFLFMNLRRFQKSEARGVLAFVREYLADGRLVRIGGEYNAKAIPLLREPLSEAYDIILDESPDNPNVKQEVWAVIGQIAPALMQAGVFLPDFFDFTPLPASLVFKIKQQMTQKQEQQQQQQQQMMEMQLKLKGKSPEELQAEIQKLNAEAELAQTRAAAIAKEMELTMMEGQFKTQEQQLKERVEMAKMRREEQKGNAKMRLDAAMGQQKMQQQQQMNQIKGASELMKAIASTKQPNYTNGVPEGKPRVM